MGGTICVCNRSKNQVTKSLLWLPFFITNKMFDCIRTAEEKLGGKPPTVLEVFVEMRIRYKELPLKNVY